MSPVGGIVLAAGPSSRFGGEAKQLARFDGEPLVRRAARTALASRLGRILVVVGHQSRTVSAVLAGLAVELVDNPRYRDGQSTSVRAGLSRLGPETEAALFLPVDQPLLSPAVIDHLIDSFTTTGAWVVVPVHRGRRRAPVLIARELFARVASIGGDEGARQLFAQFDERLIVEADFADGGAFSDVDSETDLSRLRAFR